MPLISKQDAVAMAAAVLEASRVSQTNATIVAGALVAAELDGIGSHGLSRLLAYADQAIAGKVDGFATPVVERAAAAIVHVDACDGFAYPAIRASLEVVPQRISETGLVAVSITRSHHSGVTGHHVEWLASRGLIGLFFSNAPAAIAPWGGHVPTYGTNPIAFAAPAKDAPLVIDLSLSRAARGKIMVASQKREPIPGDWAFDRHGEPTTDADAALAGSLVPIGGAKGAALALMVEILTATLTGANHAFEVTSFFDDKGPPSRAGQFILALDPARFAPGFSGRMEHLLRHVTGQPDVRLPGARRLALRAKHEAEGFLVDADLLKRIEARLGR